MNQKPDTDQRQLSLFPEERKSTAVVCLEQSPVSASPASTAKVLCFQKEKRIRKTDADATLTDRVLSLLKL